jgi:hypothetical protein
MRNGDYILILAPTDYPGIRYRGKYCYEHKYIAWKKYGRLPEQNEEVHHKNGDKFDNNPDNLEYITSWNHKKLHGEERVVEQIHLICPTCGKSFDAKPSNYRWQVKHGQILHCSRSCSVIDQHRRGLVNLVGCKGILGSSTTSRALGR